MVDFCVLLCNHVIAEVSVLGLQSKRGCVGSFLLLGEVFDCFYRLSELVLSGEFFGGKGFGPWLTDFASAECSSAFLEVGVRVFANLSLIILHHVNWFVTSHNC